MFGNGGLNVPGRCQNDFRKKFVLKKMFSVSARSLYVKIGDNNRFHIAKGSKMFISDPDNP